MKKYLFIIPVFFVVFNSCSSDDEITNFPKEEIEQEYLVNYEVIKKISRQEIAAIFSGFFLEALSSENLASIKIDDVTVYKIEYKTSYPGVNEKIIASGALVLPDNSKYSHLVSYQHGTIIDPNAIPSVFSNSNENYYAAVFASLGFFVSIPDYLGYGESADRLHPYEHGESLASASYDILMASKEFLSLNDHNVGEKLFLAGYSEGGYATMALHQYIENIGEITVTASAPGSGAYNKSAFALELFSKNEPLPFLRNYLWVIDTYNRFYNINQPWSYYVNEPYASRIDVDNPLSVFTAEIDTNPSVLFTETFRNEILSSETSPFWETLKNNDRFDWKAEAPVRLYYGKADDFVYPSNSESAYEAMSAQGSDVTLVPFEGKDHFTTIEKYGSEVFNWFLMQSVY